MIVPLVKVTICGLAKEKEEILADLQDLGCLHLIPLGPKEDTGLEGGLSPQARDALEFLLSCPRRRRQVRDSARFEPEAVEREALELRSKIQELQDERDFLRGRIADLQPWGDFTFPPREELNNLRLWFYVVPHKDMQELETTDLVWQVVHRDNRFCYVAVLSEREPHGMPVARTRTGNKPRSELEQRLEEVELELEDLEAERAGLTRWCSLFARSLGLLEDKAARAEAAAQTLDDAPLFAAQGWAPRESAEQLKTYSADRGLVLDVQEPAPNEAPPTLLRNRSAVSGAQAMVNFYMTPSYWGWDPTATVFVAFAVFFAIILSDAGYSLLMALGLGWGWKKLGRSEGGRSFRTMLLTLVGASVIWGVMAGSYFGLEPPAGSPLASLKVIDLNDFSTMMQLSILLGVAQLVWANVASAWRFRGSAAAIAPIGWALIFLGGLCVWLGGTVPAVKVVGFSVMGLGGLGVLLFTATEGPLWKRLLAGLQGLSRLTAAFGDTLSYLRLFALGLASASLAVTFNDLAGQVGSAVPGIGVLFAILIVVLGHGINLVLGVSAGVIHGLRLNFIEFFNWSVAEEGQAYEAFAKKSKVVME
jgi:V/A-type H+-transporting ATPase subunit I